MLSNKKSCCITLRIIIVEIPLMIAGVVIKTGTRTACALLIVTLALVEMLLAGRMGDSMPSQTHLMMTRLPFATLKHGVIQDEPLYHFATNEILDWELDCDSLMAMLQCECLLAT